MINRSGSVIVAVIRLRETQVRLQAKRQHMTEQIHSRSGVLSFILALLAALMTLGLAVVFTFPMANIAIGGFGGL
jgi:hypothetical protein